MKTLLGGLLNLSEELLALNSNILRSFAKPVLCLLVRLSFERLSQISHVDQTAHFVVVEYIHDPHLDGARP